jgi:gas vesicle protein
MADRSNGVLEFAAGLFIGGLVGVAIGLVLAPQPGEETRAQLAERGIELRGELKKRADELQEKMPDIMEEQRTRLQEAVEKGKEAAAKKRQEILGQLEAEKAAEAGKKADAAS